MNYKESIGYLNSFIDYEKIGYKDREIFSLDRIQQLANFFNNPEKTYPSIHIAGTKGKGSVAMFVANILKEVSYKVGVYASPHLVTFRERIKVNNEMITEDDFAIETTNIKETLSKKKLDFSPTFFEIFTLLTFNYFKTKKIDYAVIETGLGGRLDATNIVSSKVSVITSLSYDHTDVLGDTLDKIAFEKSGIIKKGTKVISAPQEDVAFKVIKDRCEKETSKLVLVGRDIISEEKYHDENTEKFNIRGIRDDYDDCAIHLIGKHQIINAECAVGAIESLEDEKITKNQIKNGLEKTKNSGRCEVIARDPYIVLDGAQNKESAKALKNTIKRNFKFNNLILVLGVSKDKDVKGILEELAPISKKIIITKASSKRALDPELIKKEMKSEDSVITGSVREAVKKCLSFSQKDDMIVVTGSFFVIGEIKEVIREKKTLSV